MGLQNGFFTPCAVRPQSEVSAYGTAHGMFVGAFPVRAGVSDRLHNISVPLSCDLISWISENAR